MGDWRPWRELRERPGVEYALVDMPPGAGRGVVVDWGDVAVILIDRKLSPVERLGVLAHELVHLERGGGCAQPDLPARLAPLVGREEERVDSIVARRLLPRARLEAFVAARAEVEPITARLVADELDVPLAVAERALAGLRGAA